MLLSLLQIAISFGLANCQNVQPSPCEVAASPPVHLTFDDGPSAVSTPQVLDILKSQKIKATFFIVGKEINSGTADLLRRMQSEDHALATHSYSHRYMARDISKGKMTMEEALDEVEKPYRDLKAMGLRATKLFRSPYGGTWVQSSTFDDVRQELAQKIKERGFEHIGWDANSADYNVLLRGRAIPAILRQLCDHRGGIVLLHDGIKPRPGESQSWTVENLPLIIEAIRCAGYKIGPLDEIRAENQKRGARGFVSLAPSVKMCGVDKEFSFFKDCPAEAAGLARPEGRQ